jgi:hypothetical protein
MRGLRDQARRFEACLKSFARHAFGRVGLTQIRCATFVLAEVPIAAVETHLQHREPPPLVDELITKTYHAIVGGGDLGSNADDSRLNAPIGRKR